MTEKISCRLDTEKLETLKQRYGGLTVTAIISRLIDEALTDTAIISRLIDDVLTDTVPTCPTAPTCPTDTEVDKIREAKNAYQREWRKRNPEMVREYNQAYHSRMPSEKTAEYRQRYWLKKLRATQ